MSNISGARREHRPSVGTQSGVRQRGFSLLELLTTVTVAGILLTIAVPSFFSVTRNSHAVTNANELVSALMIARSEAIRRGSRVTVCRSADSATCGGTWANGWIVFRDDAATDATDPPVVGQVLRVWGPPTGTPAITNGANWIRFMPRGNARSTSGTMPVTFRIAVQGCSGQQARDVEINAVGRATASKVNCP